MVLTAKKAYWFFREHARSFLRDSVVDPVKVCKVKGKRIRIGLSNPLEGFRIATYETKEPETLDWLDRSLRPGDVFFDIGANIGLYSIYAALTQPQCQVYAFEPSVLNFTRLFRNALNNNLGNFVAMNLAVSGVSKLDYLHMSQWLDGSASHGFGDDAELIYNKSDGADLKYGIFGLSLDDLVFKHGLPHPTFVKLDVDNIEEQIIDGGSRVLADSKCRGVLVEVASKPGEANRVQDSLQSFGFRREQTSDWSLQIAGRTIQNCIFSK